MFWFCVLWGEWKNHTKREREWDRTTYHMQCVRKTKNSNCTQHRLAQRLMQSENKIGQKLKKTHRRLSHTRLFVFLSHITAWPCNCVLTVWIQLVCICCITVNTHRLTNRTHSRLCERKRVTAQIHKDHGMVNVHIDIHFSVYGRSSMFPYSWPIFDSMFYYMLISFFSFTLHSHTSHVNSLVSYCLSHLKSAIINKEPSLIR